MCYYGYIVTLFVNEVSDILAYRRETQAAIRTLKVANAINFIATFRVIVTGVLCLETKPKPKSQVHMNLLQTIIFLYLVRICLFTFE